MTDSGMDTQLQYLKRKEHQLKTFMYSMINSPAFVTVMYRYQGI